MKYCTVSENLLIFLPNWVGDVVMATPALRAMRRHFAGAHITYIGRKIALDTLAGSYLFKDILELDTVRGAKKLKDLLILLAFQIGHEVSLAELGNNLDLHKSTVARYLDLLEKSFVIVNIRGFSRNLRKEVCKTSRYYFVDNGIRNSLINNFNPPKLRDDMGKLYRNGAHKEAEILGHYFK